MHDQPLLLVSEELSQGNNVMMSKLLSITGNNLLPGARLPYMRKNLQDSIPSVIVITTVDPPQLSRGTGLERRLFNLEFDWVIPEESKDRDNFYPTDLLDALVTVGITEALRMYREDDWTMEPDPAAQERFLNASDEAVAWLDDRDDIWVGTQFQEVLDAYRKYSGNPSFSPNRLGRAITACRRWDSEKQTAGDRKGQHLLVRTEE